MRDDITDDDGDDVEVPSHLRRRRLGGLMRTYRERAGLRLEDAAVVLRCTGGKVSRMERGQSPPRDRDIRDLLDRYGVSDDERAECSALLQGANTAGWWEEYLTLGRKYGSYIGYEQAAAHLRTADMQVVQGLLQTEEYAAEVIRRGCPSGGRAQTKELVDVRMKRQEILAGANPVRLTTVLDEVTLRRVVGSRALMRRQITHLMTRAAEPHIQLRVLPFDAGAPACGTGSFTLLDFPEPTDPRAVYIEVTGGDLYIEKPKLVTEYTMMFDELTADALGTDKTIRWLEDVLSTYDDE